MRIVEGVSITEETRWWGREVIVTATSPSPIPDPLILFISERGMEHGFWRDLLVGDRAFDRAFFVFSDTPSLLPFLVGPALKDAMRERDSAREAVELYLRGNEIRTSSKGAGGGRTTSRHVAIHRAVVTDYEAFRARWRDALAAVQGVAHPTWPPTGAILTRAGSLTAGLTWELPPPSRDAVDWERATDSMRTELLIDRRLLATLPGIAKEQPLRAAIEKIETQLRARIDSDAPYR